jgi:hypothetical protein
MRKPEQSRMDEQLNVWLYWSPLWRHGWRADEEVKFIQKHVFLEVGRRYDSVDCSSLFLKNLTILNCKIQ